MVLANAEFLRERLFLFSITPGDCIKDCWLRDLDNYSRHRVVLFRQGRFVFFVDWT